MANRLIDETNKWVGEFMNAGKDALKNLQDSPLGMENRSKKEYGMMMTKMQSLPQEERWARMQELANLSGHKGNKMDDCELCNWIRESRK